MMTRTDIHRPAAIIPADYEYVANEHLSPEDGQGIPELVLWHRDQIRLHMARTGGTYARHHAKSA